jgi:hypothetical protein
VYEFEGVGYLFEDTKSEVSNLEECRRNLLEEKQLTRRLKSMALWISKVDEDSNFFHQYAKYRKNINTIWKTKRPLGVDVCKFKDIALGRVEHFWESFQG